MPSAYIANLNRSLREQIISSPLPDLRTRLIDWYGGLPEISRNRPFAMMELEKALDTQGKYLSPVLLALGWRRQRKWSTKGQYLRYWLPPIA